MYIGNIKPFSIENGIGVRVSIFVSGCRNHCKNCFSEQTWAFNFGVEFTKEIEDTVIKELQPSYVDGLTILGGEPMEPENQRALLPFLERVRKECPGKTIWMYTGFRLEEKANPMGEGFDADLQPGLSAEFPFFLNDYEKTRAPAMRANTEVLPEILANLDILVDGRFEEDHKNLMIRFRGSDNQMIYNMPETLKQGKLVIEEEYMDRRGR